MCRVSQNPEIAANDPGYSILFSLLTASSYSFSFLSFFIYTNIFINIWMCKILHPFTLIIMFLMLHGSSYCTHKGKFVPVLNQLSNQAMKTWGSGCNVYIHIFLTSVVD
jgi:hypothetical protein